MSLRVRIAAIAATAVAVAVLVTSLGIYAATARALGQQTDEELRQIATEVQRTAARARGPGGVNLGARIGEFGRAGGFVQLVGPGGRAQAAGDRELPVSDRVVRAATTEGDAPRFFEDAEVDGVPLRILNVPLARGGVLQIALPVDDVAATLARLRRQLLFGGLVGMALAGGLGLVVSRRAVRPVQDLTSLAEDVTRTGDLDRRIEVTGDDEVGRLASTFNQMLGSLARARASQQQLIADASHELRTPLTSLRTNIEVLSQVDRLDATARDELIADVVGQLEEFGRLVDGLVELARGDQPAAGVTPVRLDEVVDLAIGRVATFARDREFVVDASPTTVLAEADRLDRAVTNLLDNAVKYGEGPIEVHVADGEVRVRDHGPGIAEADLAHVFDRFWRSPDARSAPGSGLGLSIVEQVASSHGGRATATNAPDGGAVVSLRLPTVVPTA